MIYYYPLRINSIKRTFLIAKNNKGVCSIEFSGDEKKFTGMLKKVFDDDVKKSKDKLKNEVKQIQDYFEGKRKSL